MLYDLLSDLVKINDILFIVRMGSSIIEMRSNSLGIRQKEKWITIGENDGPSHMHIDPDTIFEARFLQEEKPERITFSVRFFGEDDQRQFSAVFAKMYDENKKLIPERKKLYDNLFEKFGSQQTLKFN